MAEQRTSNPAQADPETRPGGYHHRGVPGEEAEVRSTMRVMKIADPTRTIRKGQPIKGGAGAESTAAGRLEDELSAVERPEGPQEVFVLARSGEEELDMPVFAAGASGADAALAVFTEREKAILYLQVAGWRQSHEIVSLAPTALGAVLREAREEGVNLVAVDMNRKSHLDGTPQPVLYLDRLVDLSNTNLFREVQAIRQP